MLCIRLGIKLSRCDHFGETKTREKELSLPSGLKYVLTNDSVSRRDAGSNLAGDWIFFFVKISLIFRPRGENK